MAKIVNPSLFIAEDGTRIYEYSLKHKLERDGKVYTRQNAPKYKGRGVRMSEAVLVLRAIEEELDSMAASEYEESDLESIIEGANNCIANIDFSMIDELRSEIVDWRDNLDGANMTHLPKYDEVSECADALDSIMDEFESLDGDVSGESVVEVQEMISEIRDKLSEILDECDGVEFPTRF